MSLLPLLVSWAVTLCFFLFSPIVPGYAKEPAKPKADPDGNVAADMKDLEGNRQKEAEEAKRLTELYLRNQNVFVRKGEVILELNTLYSRNGRQTIDNNGVVSNDTRRFLDNTLIARYGLMDGFELDLIAPVYVHGEVESDLGTARFKEQKDGVGDMGAALRYEAWYESGNRPALVIDVSGKSRTGGSGLTGTGTWNAGGGVTLIKTLDPVVFFGRLGYTYNFASQTRNLGNVIDYRIGMGFSLNDRVSFNVQFAGASVGSSTILDSDPTGPITYSVRHQEIMNLIFTTTVQVTRKLFIEPLVAVGMTENSFTIVGLRLPYRF
jgi:hypothetical protein